MRNRSNFAKGNRFSARQGSQPLGSREFRARAAALNGYLAEIAAICAICRLKVCAAVSILFGTELIERSSASFVLVFLVRFRHFVQLQIDIQGPPGIASAGHFICLGLLLFYPLDFVFHTCE